MKEQIYFNNLSEICNLANIRLGSGRYELTVYKTLKGRVSC